MKAVRRLSIAALAVACLHLVFGAIVRISGSGMGCGENWPKCYGYWIPPFSRPDLIVEVSHRYLASILVFTVTALAAVAFSKRREPGISGRGGVLRSAIGALAAVVSAAVLGGVTVKMGNAPWATVLHWLNAMTLLALVAMTAIRAGALGGKSARTQRGTGRAARSAFAAAGLAILAVALGGLTAKIPGAAAACTTVPSCGRAVGADTSAVVVQMVHRTAALLLVLHLFGMTMMVRKRRADEAPVVIRATFIALGMVLLQLVVASSMILFHMPPVLRSLHEATGVGIWLSCFCLAYLARRVESGRNDPAPEPVAGPARNGGAVRIGKAQPVASAAIAYAPVVRARAPEPAIVASEPTIVASEPTIVAPEPTIVAPEPVLVANEAVVAEVPAIQPSVATRQPLADMPTPAAPVRAPSPPPRPPHTMAVIVARGADL